MVGNPQKTLKTCPEKCKIIANRLLKVGGDDVGVEDLKKDPETLKGRFADLTDVHSIDVEEVDREVLTNEAALSPQEQKNNTNTLLLDKGAKVDEADKRGRQPLHIAAENGDKEAVELQLDRGAAINAVDIYGLQPLHVAIKNGHKEVVRLLLDKGAKVDIATASGIQPIDLAALYGHKEVVELLRNYLSKETLTRFLDKKAFPIDKSYINLALIDQKSFDDAERKSCKQKRSLVIGPQFEGLAKVELSSLFEGASRILVEGDAGSGKSTLCHYIAFSWATLEPAEHLQRLGPSIAPYEALIWLPLRDILTLPEDADLSAFIQNLYPRLIVDALDEDKTLYILDGFDEVLSLETKEDKRWEIVSSLIEKQYWLMTSRPGVFSERFSATKRLKNIGFMEPNIRSYIQRFCKDFEIPSDDLESALFASDDLKALARVPLYLELICSLWKENALSDLKNSLELYDAMAVSLFGRYIERLQEKRVVIPKELVLNHFLVQPYRVLIEKIAFLSRELGSNRITTSLYDPLFSEMPFEDEERENFGKRFFYDLGLLTPRGDPQSLLDQDYAFIHPTFEEYFAARHLVSTLDSSEKLVNGQLAKEWFQANYLLKEKELLFKFIVTLAKTDSQHDTLAEWLRDATSIDVGES